MLGIPQFPRTLLVSSFFRTTIGYHLLYSIFPEHAKVSRRFLAVNASRRSSCQHVLRERSCLPSTVSICFICIQTRTRFNKELLSGAVVHVRFGPKTCWGSTKKSFDLQHGHAFSYHFIFWNHFPCLVV